MPGQIFQPGHEGYKASNWNEYVGATLVDPNVCGPTEESRLDTPTTASETSITFKYHKNYIFGESFFQVPNSPTRTGKFTLKQDALSLSIALLLPAAEQERHPKSPLPQPPLPLPPLPLPPQQQQRLQQLHKVIQASKSPVLHFEKD